MHERNTISFVTLIQRYAQYFELGKVVELFTRLHREVHELNPFIFAIILKLLVIVECAELGCCIHACISKLGHDSNAFVRTVLTNVILLFKPKLNFGLKIISSLFLLNSPNIFNE